MDRKVCPSVIQSESSQIREEAVLGATHGGRNNELRLRSKRSNKVGL